MGSKFFVYAGKRWRELDTEDGNLEGLGRVRFLYFKQGRLNVARRAAVLRALRALGAGGGLAARDGLPLSKYEPEPPPSKRRLPSWNNFHACCSLSHRPEPVPSYCLRCANDQGSDHSKPNTSHMAVQCVSTANASTQASLSPLQEKSPIASQTQCKKPKKASERINGVELVEKSKGERKAAIPEEGTKGRKRKRSQREEIAEDSSAGDGDHLKELIIEESDVDALRRLFATDKGRTFKVDINKFDQDDAYKEKVFYAINPLVCVERCPRISQILQERRNANRISPEDNISIKVFMTLLGLRKAGEEPPVKRYKTRASLSHHDKENALKNKHVRSPKSSAQVLRVDNATSNREAKKKTRREEISSALREDNARSNREAKKARQEEFTPKAFHREARSSKANGDGVSKVKRDKAKGWCSGREYSKEEDMAIVTWVARGNRARSVKGNTIWQQMQSDHLNVTGIERSWHSLRNRYLRHLLPSLGRVASPLTAQRLRADASTGELKARKVSKENSLLAVPSVRSAWSRRPRPLPHAPSPSPSPSSPSRSSGDLYETLKGRSSTPAVGARVRRTPRFSEVLSRFDDRASSGEEPSPPKEPHRRRLYNL